MKPKNKKDSLNTLRPMDIVFYTSPKGGNTIEVYFDGESPWLSQKKMAELFGVEVNTVNYHLKEIFASGELDETSVIRKNRITAADGKQYLTGMYHLDVIIAVGYRINSIQATKFRVWATGVLREYIIKGFVLDDERLKGNNGLTDYFDELLARIRDIRASEKRAYLRIREIFAMAVDYNPLSEEAHIFFALMQNKMHFAATGMTAAELIATRAAVDKANMGLTNWKGKVVRKGDVTTAKNYLDAGEIDILNRIVNMFLEQAEFRLIRKQQIYTADWQEYLDKFLQDNELPLLEGTGSISHCRAKEISENIYDAYEQRRRAEQETAAEAKYLEDLNRASKLVLARRNKK